MKISDQIRQGVREALTQSLTELNGAYFDTAKQFIPLQVRHDAKKKFVNYREAYEWARERELNIRVYPCDLCPFFHLTNKKVPRRNSIIPTEK